MKSTKSTSFTKDDFKVIDRKIMYDGVFKMMKYSLQHKLFDGSWSPVFTREMMERPKAVGVLPYDPITDQVILIEQFRVGALANPTNPWLMEVVAGLIDENEKPEQVAIREAMEEAGCKIKRLEKICHYFVSPGGCNEEITVYIGQVEANNSTGVYGLEDESENIHAFSIPLNDALNMLQEGKINTSPAIVSLLWLQSNKERLLKLWQIK